MTILTTSTLRRLAVASVAGLALLACVSSNAQERRFRILGADAKEQRFALVVGNRAYPQGPLATPENDAADVAAALRKLGFQVVTAANLDPTRFRSTIRRFEDLLATADGRVVALVYYAGHGVQIQGKNYLLPTGVEYKDQRDVIDFGIDAEQLLARVTAQEPDVTIMILDACRDSPLPAIARSARGGSGLARMDPPAGSFLAFATSAGSTASDNYRERNGLFTKFVLQHIQEPGLTAEQVFRRVRTDVYRASRGQQLPEDNNRLVGGDFFFVPVKDDVSRSAETRRDGPAQQSPAVLDGPKSRPNAAAAMAHPAPAIEIPAAIAGSIGGPAMQGTALSAPPAVLTPVPAPPAHGSERVASLVPPSAQVQGRAEATSPATRLAQLLSRGEQAIPFARTDVYGHVSEEEATFRPREGVLADLPGGLVLTTRNEITAQSGVVYDPPIPIANADMKVGATWSQRGSFREVQGVASGPYSTSVEVIGIEDVATRAGTFRAFHLRETRWVARTRFIVDRWLENSSMIPVLEKRQTVLGQDAYGSFAYFQPPSLDPRIEIGGLP